MIPFAQEYLESGIDSMTPAEFGLPEQFTQWRTGQQESISDLFLSNERIVAHMLPPGSGKSLMYMAASRVIHTDPNHKVIILTATKALQDQLSKDFPNMVILKGKSAYPCLLNNGRTTCEDGVCNAGVYCKHKEKDCLYYSKVFEARFSPVVLTNYHCWIHLKRFKEFWNPALLVLDEGHNAPNILLAHTSVTVYVQELKELCKEELPWFGTDLTKWKRWANMIVRMLEDRIEDKVDMIRGVPPSRVSPTAIAEVLALKRLSRKLETIVASTVSKYWIDKSEVGKTKFAPLVLSKELTEKLLFRNAEKVYILSGTLSPKAVDLLGITEYDYEEYPSQFPLASRPFYHLPTVRVGKALTDEMFTQIIVRKIDKIIEPRFERKGIIHTISYVRRNLVCQTSKYKSHMFTNRKGNITDVIVQYKETYNPAFLVSPSVVQGYDFPGDTCRFQVICKVPFPSLGDKLLMERAKIDKQLIDYITMQALVQMYGRGVRSKDDWCECFILDDNIEWFLKRNRRHAPGWFLDAFIKTRQMPEMLRGER